MAYLYHPHIIEVRVTLAVIKAHQMGNETRDVTFRADRDGIELTNQLTDSIASVIDLALAGRRSEAVSAAQGEKRE